MDAELRLLLNELQHLLTLNGLKGKQHVLYIAEELGAKVTALPTRQFHQRPAKDTPP